MIYILLPPVIAPKTLGAYHRPPTLSEHRLAFLNCNNRFGFQVDDIPDEPIRLHQPATHRRKMYKASQILQCVAARCTLTDIDPPYLQAAN